MVGNRLAKKALFGRLNTGGLTGEIVPKAAITASQPSDLSGDASSQKRPHMNRYYIEHAIVAALGFLTGAVFAMTIVSGDVLVLIGTGFVFGFSACALFDQDFGGDWFWPFGRPAGMKALAAKPSLVHLFNPS